MSIKISAQAWLDELRVDRHRPGTARRSAELSAFEGTVELSIPVDMGVLGEKVTVQFPLAALMRLNQA